MNLYEKILQGLAQLGGQTALRSGDRCWSATELLEALAGGNGGDGAGALLVSRLAAMAQPTEADQTSVEVLASTIGPTPGRVVLLAPLTSDFGGHACLATWSLGAAFYHCDAEQPAAAFAVLERVDTDRLLLPERVLTRLLDHPAVLLAPEMNLQTLVIESHFEEGPEEGAGPETGPFTVRDTVVLLPTEKGLLPRREARVLLREQAGEQRGGKAEAIQSLDQWNKCIHSRLAADFTVENSEAGVAVIRELARVALLSMLNALGKQGFFSDPLDGYTREQILAASAARHRPLVARWLAALEREGLLSRRGDGFTLAGQGEQYSDAALQRAWAELQARWQQVVGADTTIQYARANGDCLPQLMAGERSAVEVLFPQGKTDLAEALYRESPAARYQHRAVAELAAQIAATREAQRPLRILEVGAGTGATTEVVLPALAGLPVRYLFTDVSRFFLGSAAARLQPDPRLQFALYDIDRSPFEQGYARGDFDLVIGGGVLNAARDTDVSVAWLKKLLSPGGWLVISEPTQEEYWVMASQAFMLADASDERAQSGRTFLDLAQWHRVLEGAGLQRLLDLPPVEHPLSRLGHRVFAARAAIPPELTGEAP